MFAYYLFNYSLMNNNQEKAERLLQGAMDTITSLEKEAIELAGYGIPPHPEINYGPYEALVVITRTLRSLIVLALQSGDDFFTKEGMINAVDLSMGDVLDFTSKEFEQFTRTIEFSDPTMHLLHDYRERMIRIIDEIDNSSRFTH